ncbi:MAG: translocation/assembly module TamB domain-containing protein [Calditrichota bacterium]
MHKGEVDLNLKESEKNLLLTSGVRETPPFLQYMINVSIPGNFYVRSSETFNSFDMMITGDLQVSQEPKNTLEMYGNLEVPKGKYLQFEDFNIRNGRIEFINPKELPNLDIIAETKKYGFLFQLHVTGDLNNPVKEIKIFDLQTQQDITHLYPETKDQISLLLFGVTFSELGSSAGNLVLDKGQEVISQALISRVEREARQFIGLDEIRVENSQSKVDYTTQRLNMPSESSVLSLGKYITPNLYLEYKTQLGSAGLPLMGEIPTPRLGWDAGDQIFLEYRINRNWSVSTYYEKQLYDKFKVDLNWQYNF